jgi:ABC-type Fe3+/spermidine/putrescine transport system ATPase subunit
MMPDRPVLSCRSVCAAYGSSLVLDHLDLDAAPGETVALLGPSGSGKTTLLAAVAGFVPLSSGTIEIAGEPVSGPGLDVAPERRSVSMVFQNYALWPHLTALDTVAYPLRRSGADRATAATEAARLLERVGIGELAGRYPSELSGGQQQRVGLARALAKSPAVFLFDEPTAHLDAPLRSTLQEELIDRQRETGATALYASHDPSEALAVADRLVLIRDGRVVQQGAPHEIYESPADAWAARLSGTAAVVAVPLLDRRGDVGTVRIGDVDVAVAIGGEAPGPVVSLVVRPEWGALGGRLTGTIHRVRYAGSRTLALLDTPVGRVWIEVPRNAALRSGETVGWSLRRAWMVAGQKD